MDQVTIECANCNASLEAPPELSGEVVTCPECGTQIDVPGELHLAVTFDMPESDHEKKTFEHNPKLAAILLVSVLVACAGGYWFASRVSAMDKALRYMPDGLVMLGVVHYADIIESPIAKAAYEQLPHAMESQKMTQELIGLATGFTDEGFDQINRVWIGANLRKSLIAYFEFKEDISSERVETWFKDREFQSSIVGDREVYQGESIAFCVVGTRAAIFGEPEDIKAVLNRDRRPQLAKGMKAALKSVDMAQSVCIAVTLQAKGMNSLRAPTPDERRRAEAIRRRFVTAPISEDNYSQAVAGYDDLLTAQKLRDEDDDSAVDLVFRDYERALYSATFTLTMEDDVPGRWKPNSEGK